jgi:molybdopterin molybdotransferase
MLNVKSVSDVYDIIKENFSNYKPNTEIIDIKDAVGRINADDVFSGDCIPNFNRSSVDGYAVMGSDTFGASDSIPSQLEIIGEIKMGEAKELSIKKGQTMYVPTGGEIPKGADSVVMIEYTENLNDGYIYINKAVPPSNNVVNKGDDIKEGQLLIKANKVLRPQDIGALAAIGKAKIKVRSRLKVGIISTGDELTEINNTPTMGKVRDINSYALYAGLTNMGAEPVMYGIITDSFDAILSVTKKAIWECDIVLISGGSSVGTKDETYNVIASLGEVLVHGIAIKPGKPTILGKVDGKTIFGLPGHPASAYFIFKLFIGFLISQMYNKNEFENIILASMNINYSSNTGREEYLPIILERNENGYIAQPILGKSGLVTLLTKADGYIKIPRGAEGIAVGEKVSVILF